MNVYMMMPEVIKENSTGYIRIGQHHLTEPVPAGADVRNSRSKDHSE